MTHLLPHAKETKIAYGDFQTPLILAKQICQKLNELGVAPDVVIEPTCGIGAFVIASAHAFPQAQKIIGVEINQTYLDELTQQQQQLSHPERITLKQGDFFKFDWQGLLHETEGVLLILGNLPWVTNSQQGIIQGANLPTKLNFQNHHGLDALTGKSNFDISEWMLMQFAQWLKKRKGHLAILCKSAVARKFLHHLHAQQIGLAHSAIYRIDAKRHFDVVVEACLLFCAFDPAAHNHDYEVYDALDSLSFQRVGHRYGITIRDLEVFQKYFHLFGQSDIPWRSGIKHDCASVMEFRQTSKGYTNGLNETTELEPDLLYPLLKGSDVANNRIMTTERYILVTQKTMGEPTQFIKHIVPKTWAYLEAHASLLDARKSRIYRHNPRFAIFGVGAYTFAPYKIAICGLYKNLDFRLVGPIGDKPTVFDDTVYFLSFESHAEALEVLKFLTSNDVQNFLSAMIFWDEKRPIKTGVLNRLKLQQQEKMQMQLL